MDRRDFATTFLCILTGSVIGTAIGRALPLNSVEEEKTWTYPVAELKWNDKKKCWVVIGSIDRKNIDEKTP